MNTSAVAVPQAIHCGGGEAEPDEDDGDRRGDDQDDKADPGLLAFADHESPASRRQVSRRVHILRQRS